MKERGSVLVQVLITAVVAAVIAAGLMQMLLLRHTVVLHSVASAEKRKQAEAHLSNIMTAWNAINWTCGNVNMAGVGYNCPACNDPPGPPPQQCMCIYTALDGTRIRSTGPLPPPVNCTLQIDTPP